MDTITHDLEIWLIVVLLDPLKIFQNLFVQMFAIIFMANQNFQINFLWGSHISTVSITALSRTCNGAKLYVSVVDTFAVTNNHLVG